MGRAEVARQLGLKEGTAASRLAEARKRLQRRLAARGISLAAVLGAAAVWPGGGKAAMPAVLAGATARAACGYAAGGPAAGASARAVALAEGVRKALLAGRLLTGALVLLAAGLAAGGLVAGQRTAVPPAASPPDTAKADPAPAKAAVPAGETFTYAGRVLGPDGKPLARAKVSVSGLTPGVIEFRERTITGSDGTFRFTLRRDEFGDKGVVPPGRSPPERYVIVGATAPGCGAACDGAGNPEDREKLTIWLPAEEVVHGRVVSLEGKPVAGVHVNAYIHSSRADKDHRPLPYDAPDKAGRFWGNVLPYDVECNEGVTGKDGRVTLRGLGRGWLYDLSLSGPTIVHVRARLVARPQKPDVVGGAGVYVQNRPFPPEVPLYGSTFTHVAPPCKPIRGTVREKGSGKPVAGIEVGRAWARDDDPAVWATTDKEGRYKLIGLPAGVHTLKVQPAQGMPYLATEFRVTADQPGLAPVTFDFQFERQPAVTGRVIDRATGKPIRGWVEYRPMAGNPSLKVHSFLAEPRWANHPPSTATDKDGRFLLPVLRGPGVLLVRAESDYLPAALEKADRVADATDPELIDCRPYPAWPGEFHAYRLIDVQPDKDADVVIALAPGRARPLVLEFPDGKDYETTVLGLKPPVGDRGEAYAPGKTPIVGLTDGEARRLFMTTQDGRFAAAAVVDGTKAGPVRVKLQPTGAITGRVVDGNGKPLVGVSLQVLFEDGPGRPGVFAHTDFAQRLLTPAEKKRSARTRGFLLDKFDYVTSPEKTDDHGRFRLTGVLPGVAFDLRVQLLGPPDAKGPRLIAGMVAVARTSVKPGETLDLGDLRALAPAGK
jgi:hypothetical protein